MYQHKEMVTAQGTLIIDRRSKGLLQITLPNPLQSIQKKINTSNVSNQGKVMVRSVQWNEILISLPQLLDTALMGTFT